MQSLFSENAPPPAEGPQPRSKLSDRLLSPLSAPAPFHVSRWLFLRLLGLAYLCAFVSLWVQLDGLMGSGGILPADRLMELAREQLSGRVDLFPTLLWISASDTMLYVLTAGGGIVAILLVLGIAPTISLPVLWALYLSLSQAGQVFFSFQWDTLLLETGFLAIWLAPLTLSPPAERRAAVRRPALWLMWWLLFRLMFESGFVKLSSGDPTWSSFTALRYHFETQPLPTWVGWFAHQLPGAVLWVMTAVLFVIELAIPFLIFMPTRLRHAACAALVTLQVLILLTGNYCFFNLLTLALCVLLLDDSIWPEALRRFARGETPAPAKDARSWPLAVLVPVAAVLFVLSLAPTTALLGISAPRWLAEFHGWVQPFRTVNSYGLFAVMTTERPEIVVEGSADGATWMPYTFRYKPGALARRPGFVAPHQPRLDWQMWFAALDSVDRSPWFLRFVQRLLSGSAEVEALLETNPFPDEPPMAIRAVLYDYHFTDIGTLMETGNWWRRDNPRQYCPPVRLDRDGRLIVFEAVPKLEPDSPEMAP